MDRYATIYGIIIRLEYLSTKDLEFLLAFVRELRP